MLDIFLVRFKKAQQHLLHIVQVLEILIVLQADIVQLEIQYYLEQNGFMIILEEQEQLLFHHLLE